MIRKLIVCRFALLLVYLIPGAGFSQALDIHPHTDYGKDGEILRLKYEYYFDFWSEREVKHGRYSEWDKKGQLRLDCFYKHDQPDSIWKVWYKNGKLSEAVNYKEGQLHGTARVYAKSGWMQTELTFRNGKPDGMEFVYRKSGELRMLSQYKQGRLDGHRSFYNARGEKTREWAFENGKRIEGKEVGGTKKENQKPARPASGKKEKSNSKSNQNEELKNPKPEGSQNEIKN